MKVFSGLALLFLCTAAEAVERLSLDAVDSNALTKETQLTSGEENAMDFVWWIPVEFWEVTLRGNPAISAAQVAEVVDTLKPYSVVAVVQADISSFGAFHFFDEKKVTDGLDVRYVSDDGSSTPVPVGEAADPDLLLLLNQLSPILTAAMGNMGENFYFFPLPDTDRDGRRLVSPYEPGRLQITLTARENVERAPYVIEFPLDSLHLPRRCPNGKPAHISWTHCPWGGRKLED